MRSLAKTRILAILYLGFILFASRAAFAHCDTMDGPVVADAKAALEKGEVAPVLKWVSSGQEAEIKQAFEQVLAVRKLDAQARQLADRYFFETLVRVHRASEGEPYTGLKPAGTGVDPAVAQADHALETGEIEGLANRIGEQAADGIRRRFHHAREAKQHVDEDVPAGRQYVRAYVEFVHYVERLHQDAAGSPAHHRAPEEPASSHQH